MEYVKLEKSTFYTLNVEPACQSMPAGVEVFRQGFE